MDNDNELSLRSMTLLEEELYKGQVVNQFMRHVPESYRHFQRIHTASVKFPEEGSIDANFLFSDYATLYNRVLMKRCFICNNPITDGDQFLAFDCECLAHK